jgi:hypothetical protein
MRRPRPGPWIKALLAAATTFVLLGPSCGGSAGHADGPARPVVDDWTRSTVATAAPPSGVLLAWNNLYPRGAQTARWYAQTLGLTGTYLSSPGEAAVNVPYLTTGLRLFTGRMHIGEPEQLFSVPAPGTGSRYLHKGGRWVTNPWHPDAVAAIARGVDRLLAPGAMSPEVRGSIRYLLLDTESILAPPARDLDAPGQAEAVALVAEAARRAGVLRGGEEFPLLRYGIAARDDRLFDESGALRSDSPEFRVLDWWFAGGAGPGRLWNAAMERARAALPGVYVTSDPIAGSESRPTVPVFAAKASGLDFVQNWFNVTGRADRLPIYSALMLLIAKASGLPVVQGPQLFPEVDVVRACPGDLVLTANLLTLAFGPRNGAADPGAPWGVVHWGLRGVTDGVTDGLLRPFHKGATQRLLANLAANSAEVIPAIRATRRFLDANQAVLAEATDLPPRVGIVLSKGGHYVAPQYEWWTYFQRLSEYPYALLPAHIPFAFVAEDDDFARYDVLVLPHSSYPTDRLVAKLAAFRGTVTGSLVPRGVASRIPGWKAPPPPSEVGAWPWGNQHGCPLGGHYREMKADAIRAWLLHRAAKYKTFFTALVGEPEVDGDPEVLLNVMAWRGKKVVFAVNHRMRSTVDPYAADTAEAWTTAITVRGHWKGGTYSAATGRTEFPIEFRGPDAKVLVLEPAD